MAQNFSTKSVIVFDERRGVYRKGQEIRISVPATSVPLLLAKGQTQLRFKLKLAVEDGQLQVAAALNNLIGAEALIRELTIQTLNGVVLEHIDQYNTLAYIKAHYGRNQTDTNKAALTRGAGCCKSVSRNPFFSLTNTLAATGTYTLRDYEEVEILLPLDLSGLLGSANKRIVPLIAMDGGIMIRILLEPDAERVVQGVSVVGDGNTNDGGVYNKYLPMGAFSLHGGGIPFPAATVNIPIDTEAEIQPNYNTVNLLSLHTNPGAAAADAQLLVEQGPIMVGSLIKVYDPVANVIYEGAPLAPTTVVSVSAGAGAPVANHTNIVLANNLGVGAVADHSRIVLDIDSATNFDYIISNVELICASVQAPAGYLQDLQSKMASGGLNYDYQTQTCYNVNTQANTTFHSIYIPANESRALSVLSVPRPLLDVVSGPSSAALATVNQVMHDATTTFRNYADGIRPTRCIESLIHPVNYHYIINNKRIPTRNVDLERLVHHSDRSKLANAGGVPTQPCTVRFSATHTKEVEDALSNCGWDIRNLDRPDLAFCIARNFSRYGHTSDLSNQIGELRLNVNYTNCIIPQVWCNYLVHIRRLVLTNTGVAVQI